MPRRETVPVKIDKIRELADINDWSDAALARKVGKHSRWISEVRRGRNLPSPEEAALMCAILQVRPEEILTEQNDIALVQGLIDGQKEKPAPADRDGLNSKDKRLIEWFRSLPPETQKAILTLGDGPKDLAE